MPKPKTHRLVKKPSIAGRYLAEYMAASEQRRRTIIRDCKYRAIARILQHDEAKAAVSKFIRDADDESDYLVKRAQELRDHYALSDFERDTLDVNADYIERFNEVCDKIDWPDCYVEAPGPAKSIDMNGVQVSPEIYFRFSRTTKTNKQRVGAGTLRYAKGKTLPKNVAEWQSAFLFGYLTEDTAVGGADPEFKLCLTVDAYAGVAHSAPSNSVSRFKNMQAACASIAERWPNIAPPPGAIF